LCWECENVSQATGRSMLWPHGARIDERSENLQVCRCEQAGL